MGAATASRAESSDPRSETTTTIQEEIEEESKQDTREVSEVEEEDTKAASPASSAAASSPRPPATEDRQSLLQCSISENATCDDGATTAMVDDVTTPARDEISSKMRYTPPVTPAATVTPSLSPLSFGGEEDDVVNEITITVGGGGGGGFLNDILSEDNEAD